MEGEQTLLVQANVHFVDLGSFVLLIEAACDDGIRANGLPKDLFHERNVVKPPIRVDSYKPVHFSKHSQIERSLNAELEMITIVAMKRVTITFHEAQIEKNINA